MPTKRRPLRMQRDDVAWQRSDEEIEVWGKSLHKKEVYQAVGNLIKKHRPGEALELHLPIKGGYNVVYRLEYKDGSSAAMRIPCKTSVKFPEENLRYEVAIMRYLSANTTIPVPKVYHFGTAEENPVETGPFIIMEYIEHETTMSHVLNDPTLDPDEDHILDPDISQDKLEFLYRQMANILLQLSTLTFPQIGSLVEDMDGHFSVSGRPLIQNMNSLVEFAGMPESLFPCQQYSSAAEWYSALADMHSAQLLFQRNDAVLDEDDARDKYVARQLFRRLASEGKLSPEYHDTGNVHDSASTFKIFSEDLRPSNVLIDKDLRVVGVIDWEFAYVAPAQFSYDPPWWLLLRSPESWPGGYASFIDTYQPRLDVFLRALEAEERGMRTSDMDTHSSTVTQSLATNGIGPLSVRMRRSWENRAWMINYAARNSWAFDFIFWRYLDERFFGSNEDGDHHARLSLLSVRQSELLEPLVKMKMKQREERTLSYLDHNHAAALLARFLA